MLKLQWIYLVEQDVQLVYIQWAQVKFYLRILGDWVHEA